MRIIESPNKKAGIVLLSLLIFLSADTVAQAPVIIANPPGYDYVCAGSNTTITIAASNNPTSYSWEISTNYAASWGTLSDSANFSGTATATLTITGIPAGFNGFYFRCSASNASGSSPYSNFTILPVDTPPAIGHQNSGSAPDALSVCRGSIAAYNAYFTGNDNLESWTYSGTGMHAEDVNIFFNKDSLVPMPLLHSDTGIIAWFDTTATSGILSVTATNTCGTSAPAVFSITVNTDPQTLAGISGSTTCSYPYFIVSNGTNYSDASCNLVATIAASGANPVVGEMTACVTLQPSVQSYNGVPYVQRYYNIEPTFGQTTSTATITLYFTQTDFDNYNLARGTLPSLPTGPADIADIPNILITQLHGSGTTPGTYVGTAGVITPSAVVWNSVSGLWEITFSVTGFSGFFISTGTFAGLPLTLLDFAGVAGPDANQLHWTTTAEKNTSHFAVERSKDGKNFSPIGDVDAINDFTLTNNYTYDDNFPGGSRAMYYYRLQMIDLDGAFSYSNIVLVQPYRTAFSVDVLPDPFEQELSVVISSPYDDNANILILNTNGQIVFRKTISFTKGITLLPIDAGTLPKGIYFLHIATSRDKQIKKLAKIE